LEILELILIGRRFGLTYRVHRRGRKDGLLIRAGLLVRCFCVEIQSFSSCAVPLKRQFKVERKDVDDGKKIM
jgi:hypothetical protein